MIGARAGGITARAPSPPAGAAAFRSKPPPEGGRGYEEFVLGVARVMVEAGELVACKEGLPIPP
jgi:hypothetical protein